VSTDAASIKAWFGLQRPNYILDPIKDVGWYAPRSGIDIPSMVEELRISLVTERPPKKLFWGLYGGGKTHTLMAVTHELESIMAIRPVYVECPNVTKKSTFLELYHDGVLAALGQTLVLSLFERTVDQCFTEAARAKGPRDREALLEKLNSALGDEELARAVASLLQPADNRRLHFWRYISGVSVPSRELVELGVTEDLTQAEPSKLAQMIVVIGRVARSVEGKTLTLILDELDRLRWVGEEAASTFENAFRKLLDPNQKDIGVLMGCSASAIKELPLVFGQGDKERGPVLSRMNSTDLIPVNPLDPADIKQFIAKLVGFVRDPAADAEAALRRAQDATKEHLSGTYFPFSDEAIDALESSLRQSMTPRELTLRMTHAVGRAFLNQALFVGRDSIAA